MVTCCKYCPEKRGSLHTPRECQALSPGESVLLPLLCSTIHALNSSGLRVDQLHTRVHDLGSQVANSLVGPEIWDLRNSVSDLSRRVAPPVLRPPRTCSLLYMVYRLGPTPMTTPIWLASSNPQSLTPSPSLSPRLASSTRTAGPEPTKRKPSRLWFKSWLRTGRPFPLSQKSPCLATTASSKELTLPHLPTSA